MRREGGSEEGVSEGGREGERERREGGRGKEKRGWVGRIPGSPLCSCTIMRSVISLERQACTS